jgi:hypothetical protein
MDGTIIGQGTFTVAAGVPGVNVMIPSGADWMKVYNYTQAGVNGAANTGVKFYWQRGMAPGTGMVEYKTAAGVAALSLDTLVSGGFTLLDTSSTAQGNPTALTAITAANPPVVTTAGTLPLVGSIVRFTGLDNQPQIRGIDFTVTAAGGGTFTVGNINLTNSVASTAGSWRTIPFGIWYPSRRIITYISSTAQAKIYMSVTHGYSVGQEVRLLFPGGARVWGAFAQLDGLAAIITAVNAARAGNEPNNAGTANNIVVNIDTSAYPAWNTFGNVPNNNLGNQGYVPAAQGAFTPAEVVPFGDDTATALAQVPPLSSLEDSVQNLAYIGMTLGTGGNGTALGAAITGPAGSVAADVMYWVAGKSTYGGL